MNLKKNILLPMTTIVVIANYKIYNTMKNRYMKSSLSTLKTLNMLNNTY